MRPRCSWCFNKVVFTSEGEAQRVAGRMRRKRGYRKRGDLDVYPCPVERGTYHIGHGQARGRVAS